MNWSINAEVGQQNGVNAMGVPIIARHNSWRLHFSDYLREAQPIVKAADFTVTSEQGAVWCVTVPSPHLIMVRRVIKRDGDIVKLASRPVIVGNTQQSFEALNARAVAVVVDPIQSVKGKVVIDAFRLINPQLIMLGQEPRQTTSNIGHLHKPSIQALIHGLNRHYYSIPISYRKNELEQKMLMNLHKKKWTDGLTITPFDEHTHLNEKTVTEMLDLAKQYQKSVQEEDKISEEKRAIANVGKLDPKRHLEQEVQTLMSQNILQTLSAMLDTVVF